ncbi:MAG: type transport system ATP-binding protein [Thermoleophilia bacterium]|nr:type transport system ATP-binding protein [Thermoleophilia bacterium]
MSDAPASAIYISHARKRLGEIDALRDVSFTVAEGSIFGFLGPNGAGKTTTLRALIGMIRLDGGEARVFSLDPWRDRVALHRRMGYLPAGADAYPRMRGTDALDHAAALSQSGAPLRRLMLDALQLSDTDLDRPVSQYSKGMRQKLAIVQATQHDPDLLLLDEPSDGLDPLVQHALYDVLQERAAAGRTIVFSSHALAEVEALCDSVAIIRRGELVVQSTLDDLRGQRPRVVRLRVTDTSQLARLGPAFLPQPADHEGRSVFNVSGPADAIIAKLAGLHIDDVLIEEPSLDDVFRSYYRDDHGEPIV